MGGACSRDRVQSCVGGAENSSGKSGSISRLIERVNMICIFVTAVMELGKVKERLESSNLYFKI